MDGIFIVQRKKCNEAGLTGLSVVIIAVQSFIKSCFPDTPWIKISVSLHLVRENIA